LGVASIVDVDAQGRVDAIYSKDQKKWCELSIQAASCMAKFSTDRTIDEYSRIIWGVKPAPRPVSVGGDSHPAFANKR